jgi:hypothetical protein
MTSNATVPVVALFSPLCDSCLHTPSAASQPLVYVIELGFNIQCTLATPLQVRYS